MALASGQRWLREAASGDIAEDLYGRGELWRSYAIRFMLLPPETRPFAHPYFRAGFYYNGA